MQRVFVLSHRGHQITEAITARAQQWRARRSRKLRYRQPRFLNRAKRLPLIIENKMNILILRISSSYTILV